VHSDSGAAQSLLSRGSGTIWRVVDARVELPHDNPKLLPGPASNLVAYHDFDIGNPSRRFSEKKCWLPRANASTWQGRREEVASRGKAL
jgi:hypothetical protein